MKESAVGVFGQSINMESDMHWQLPTKLGACKHMEFKREGKRRKLIRLACTYVVMSREEISLIQCG